MICWPLHHRRWRSLAGDLFFAARELARRAHTKLRAP
jgi:hypothetical protein